MAVKYISEGYIMQWRIGRHTDQRYEDVRCKFKSVTKGWGFQISIEKCCVTLECRQMITL